MDKLPVKLMLLNKNNRVKASFSKLGDLPVHNNLSVHRRITIDADNPVISQSNPSDKYMLQADDRGTENKFVMKDIVLFIAES